MSDPLTADTAAAVDVVAEVLAEHDWFTPRGYAWPCCQCGAEFPSNDEAEVYAHVAAAVVAALSGEPTATGAAGAARVLNEAADEVRRIRVHGLDPGMDSHPTARHFEQWLRDRAATAPDPGEAPPATGDSGDTDGGAAVPVAGRVWQAVADRTAVERVRALHVPDPSGEWCNHCWMGPARHIPASGSAAAESAWPCPTIRALAGTEETR